MLVQPGPPRTCSPPLCSVISWRPDRQSAPWNPASLPSFPPGCVFLPSFFLLFQPLHLLSSSSPILLLHSLFFHLSLNRKNRLSPFCPHSLTSCHPFILVCLPLFTSLFICSAHVYLWRVQLGALGVQW